MSHQDMSVKREGTRTVQIGQSIHDRKAVMRRMKIAAAGFVSAAAVGGMLVAAPSSAFAATTTAVPPSVTTQAAADTCGQAMDASTRWIWSLGLGIQPYADPRAQVELLRVMARAYTGSVGFQAQQFADYVEVSCL